MGHELRLNRTQTQHKSPELSYLIFLTQQILSVGKIMKLHHGFKSINHEI
jgi:hypothetical protein